MGDDDGVESRVVAGKPLFRTVLVSLRTPKRSEKQRHTELRRVTISSGGDGLEGMVGLAVLAAVPVHDGGKLAGGRRCVPGIRLECADFFWG